MELDDENNGLQMNTSVLLSTNIFSSNLSIVPIQWQLHSGGHFRREQSNRRPVENFPTVHLRGELSDTLDSPHEVFLLGSVYYEL